MIPSTQELIWQGRLHIGDEPGTYGDAAYTGLGCELACTLRQFDPKATDDPTFVLEAEHVKVYKPYPGHRLTVTVYEDDGTGKYTWKETLLADKRITDDDTEFAVPMGGRKGPVFISVRVRADTSVTPGLYGDFVLTSLALKSGKHGYYASFGFDNPM